MAIPKNTLLTAHFSHPNYARVKGRIIKILPRQYVFTGNWEKWSAADRHVPDRVPEEKLLCIHSTGRSGTKFLKYALKAANLDLDHERTGPDGTVTHWFHVDSDWFPVMYWYPGRAHVGERRTDFVFKHEWHVVRNPLYAIRSIGNKFPMFEYEFLACNKVIDPHQIRRLNAEQRAALLWVSVNESIERLHPDVRFQIEQVEKEWPYLLNKLQRAEVPFPKDMKPMNKSSGFNKYEPIKRGELTKLFGKEMADRIRELGTRYGYKV